MFSRLEDLGLPSALTPKYLGPAPSCLKLEAPGWQSSQETERLITRLDNRGWNSIIGKRNRMAGWVTPVGGHHKICHDGCLSLHLGTVHRQLTKTSVDDCVLAEGAEGGWFLRSGGGKLGRIGIPIFTKLLQFSRAQQTTSNCIICAENPCFLWAICLSHCLSQIISTVQCTLERVDGLYSSEKHPQNWRSQLKCDYCLDSVGNKWLYRVVSYTGSYVHVWLSCHLCMGMGSGLPSKLLRAVDRRFRLKSKCSLLACWTPVYAPMSPLLCHPCHATHDIPPVHLYGRTKKG